MDVLLAKPTNPFRHVSSRKSYLAPALIGSTLLFASCGEEKSDTRASIEVPAEKESAPVAREAKIEKKLSEAAVTFLEKKLADSPLGFHPLSLETLAKAKAEQRMIAIFVVGSHPSHEVDVISQIGNEPGIAEELNSFALPVLVDYNRDPELLHLAFASLALTKEKFSFPNVIWCSDEGSLLGSARMQETSSLDHAAYFRVVLKRYGPLWLDDRDVIRKDAASRSAEQIEAVLARAEQEPPSKEELEEELLAAYREISTYYDSTIQDVVGGGNRVNRDTPTALMDAAFMPGLRKFEYAKAREAFAGIIDAMIGRGVFDPVDRLFFTGKTRSGYDLFVLRRSGENNVMLNTLLHEAAIRLDDEALAQFAKEHLESIREHYRVDNMLVSDDFDLLPEDQLIEMFAPSEETLEKILSAEVMTLGREMYDFKRRGNVPFDADVLQSYTERNILASPKSVADTAAALGWTEEKVLATREDLFVAMRQHRIAIGGERKKETFSPLGYNAKYISALTQAYECRADQADLDEAIALATRINEDLVVEGRYLKGWSNGNAIQRGAPANHVSLYANALIDLADASGDPRYVDLSLQAIKTLQENYRDETGTWVVEPPSEERILSSPLVADFMILEPSSLSNLQRALHRLQARNADLEGIDFGRGVAQGLGETKKNSLLTMTDQLQAFLIKSTDQHLQITIPSLDPTSAQTLRAAIANVPSGVQCGLLVDLSATGVSFQLLSDKEEVTAAESLEEMLTILWADKTRPAQ